MKHLEHGRNQTLAGKRKSNKPSNSKPSATRSRQVALRKKTRKDNAAKRAKTAAKREAEVVVAAPAAE
ncbi:MAG: hypothetical protein JW942_06425 [Opitutales bacterium]|nr:hypothetical protein [Opitutales bacterium]